MALQVWLPLNGDLHNQGLGKIISSGNANYTAGKLGQCLYCNDGNHNITLDLTNSNIKEKEYSICFWVKYNSNTSSGYNWAFQWKDNINAYSGFIYPAGKKLYFHNEYTPSGGSTSQAHFFADISYTDTALNESWHHYCFTYNYTKNIVKGYLDGNLYDTKSRNNNPEENYLTTLYLKYNNVGPYINDLRIYNHCLSAKEVKEISQGLILHYKLNNEGLGGENILTNSSGHNGTSNWSGLVTVGYENNTPFLIAKRTDTTTTSRTFCTHTAITSLVTSWTPGIKFTLSGYYKIPSTETYAVTGNMFIRWTHTTSASTYTDTGFYTSLSDPKDKWIYFEKIYEVPNNYQNGAVNFYLSAFSQGLSTIYWKNIKLEKGSAATYWSPAKTDNNYPMQLNTTIYDSSGFNNNGSVVNSLSLDTTSPQHLICTCFDGISSAISVPPLILPEITVAFWMKRNANTGTRQFMYTAWTGITCELTTSGVPTFAVNKSSYPTISGNAITTSSGWVHYCGTFSLTDGMKLYQNGVQVASNSNNNPIVYGITTSYIGLYSSMYYNGNLSDFRIYATALSADDIKKLYRTSKIVSGTTVSPRSLE